MLTKKQLAARDGKLTASSISPLMTGDKERIIELWKMMVGDPSYVSPDFSDNWPVTFGSATEAVNLYWYEKRHGKLTRAGEVVTHENGWLACTLDSWDYTRRCPVEAKSVGGYEKAEVIRDRYFPQMITQMIVTGAKECAFSVIYGGKEPVVEFVPFDAEYAKELMTRATKFMEHVRNLTPPVEMDPIAAPIIPVKEIDMTGSNQWAYAAADWLKHKDSAKEFDKAVDGLKELTPRDAIRAHGHLVEVRRDKAGRLKITEMRK